MNKKATFAFLSLVLGAVSLWAATPQAVLQSLKGKVEVRTSTTSDWTPATEGEVLDIAATLSTGFDSSVLVVMGKTTLQVKPLTPHVYRQIG